MTSSIVVTCANLKLREGNLNLNLILIFFRLLLNNLFKVGIYKILQKLCLVLNFVLHIFAFTEENFAIGCLFECDLDL